MKTVSQKISVSVPLTLTTYATAIQPLVTWGKMDLRFENGDFAIRNVLVQYVFKQT